MGAVAKFLGKAALGGAAGGLGTYIGHKILSK
ncbi:GatB family leaderless bacteriocin [Staphylococcus aureus]|nr:GatB family leaderless bacteriocin [Staphylococcus aureus]UXT71733.1 GatB family leaderless bacteriocin [Staphylococcus aureus]UXT95748.1 GatB family leaderless bacteriocin [Staphylococcus aureus]UXU14049.1 GatB family leaderless bacteriocin [Staphylococcus aureus]HEA0001852.1 GatB family leaderless bacteriocin [Staphylococcus aureus]HEA0068156.1 GatB family leaderless bacteriocin [Staphylococcus aureus]